MIQLLSKLMHIDSKHLWKITGYSEAGILHMYEAYQPVVSVSHLITQERLIVLESRASSTCRVAFTIRHGGVGVDKLIYVLPFRVQYIEVEISQECRR